MLARSQSHFFTASVRHAATQVITEQHVCLGYNYRMTDIQAAVGIEQLKQGLDQARQQAADDRRAVLQRHQAILARLAEEENRA